MSSRRSPPAGVDAAWNSKSERGSRLGLGFLSWAIRSLGSAPLRPLLPLVAGYYCLCDSTARRASRDYLIRISRASGRGAPRFRDIYRHFYTFAEVILDRLALWSGSWHQFDVAIHGREHMLELVEQNKSAMLVGAHLGSFDMLRVVAREANIPVNVIMYVKNAEQINAAFENLDPDSMVRVIKLDPNSARTAFEMRRCINRGEFLAVLADRVDPRYRKRVSRVSFLGGMASFPDGPFLLPMLMNLPVILTLAVKAGPQKYDVFMERLSDGQVVPPRERKQAVSDQIHIFASRLEHYCLSAPSQWFNFYDFWSEADDAKS